MAVSPSRYVAPPDIRCALEKSAALVAALCDDDSRVVKFTGVWSHLGTTTVGAVLDEADAALSSTCSVSDEHPSGRDLGLGAKPASAIREAETPVTPPAKGETR